MTAYSKIKTILFLFTLFHLIGVNTAFSNDPPLPQEETQKIYKYMGQNNVLVFTDDINKVPKRFRDKVTILEAKKEKPFSIKKIIKKAKVAPKTISESLSFKDPFIRQILIFTAVLILFWIIKLWIKNMILKLIARVAIKIAIVGFLYMVAHQWFFAPKGDSFLNAVKESFSQYSESLTLEKASNQIKAYNQKQADEKKVLDAIASDPPIIDKRGR